MVRHLDGQMKHSQLVQRPGISMLPKNYRDSFNLHNSKAWGSMIEINSCVNQEITLQKNTSSDIWIYGKHAVMQQIEHTPKGIMAIYRDDKVVDEQWISRAKQLGIPIKNIDHLHEKSHEGFITQGLMAQIKPPQILSLKTYLNQGHAHHRLLLLDEVQDPHNFGACIRVAAAADATAVIISKHDHCPLNATVFRTSAGAAAFMPIVAVSNLTHAIDTLKNQNLWFYATSEHAESSIYDCQFDQDFCFMMGNEGRGLRKKLIEHADFLVSIPTVNRQKSLNISVATGICLFEVRRQRLMNH